MGDAMRATAMSGSRRTTLVAGVASAGALLLQPAYLGGLRIQPTPDMGSTLVLRGPVVEVVTLILTAVAAAVLARGVRGEPGLLAASRMAGTAVLVHAAATVAGAVERAVTGPLSEAAASTSAAVPPGVILAGEGIEVIRVAALVALALAVVRGRLLEPLARAGLVVLGAAAASHLLLLLVAGLLPSTVGGSPLLLLAVALPIAVQAASVGCVVGLLVHGRSAAMRARAEAIRRAW
jgi:hypothetical protein